MFYSTVTLDSDFKFGELGLGYNPQHLSFVTDDYSIIDYDCYSSCRCFTRLLQSVVFLNLVSWGLVTIPQHLSPSPPIPYSLWPLIRVTMVIIGVVDVLLDCYTRQCF